LKEKPAQPLSKSYLATIQMTSGMEVKRNLQAAEKLIHEASAAGAQLIVLPENFALMTTSDADKLSTCEKEGSGPIQDFLAEQAAKHKIWLVGGTIPLRCPEPHKAYNACPVYDAEGKLVACYKKIHLFDAQVKPGVEVYEESTTIHPGNEIIVIDSPFGRLGLAICYDLRFPELFRVMATLKAEIIAIPTAFTVKTGQAHWEVLMRARAIENFCYLLGACQTGVHETGRKTFGHSLIIDPWGTVLACLPSETGFIQAEVSLDYLKQLRSDFPVHQHRRVGLPKSGIKKKTKTVR
jgi:predicted amidohydrolase